MPVIDRITHDGECICLWPLEFCGVEHKPVLSVCVEHLDASDVREMLLLKELIREAPEGSYTYDRWDLSTMRANIEGMDRVMGWTVGDVVDGVYRGCKIMSLNAELLRLCEDHLDDVGLGDGGSLPRWAVACLLSDIEDIAREMAVDYLHEIVNGKVSRDMARRVYAQIVELMRCVAAFLGITETAEV